MSHAERAHVVELLQKAVALGLIDLDEFSDRADQALTSRTREELNVLLVDLPGLVVAPLPEHTPLNLKLTSSSLVRNGRWTVPPAVNVQARAGEMRLDFSEAEFLSRVVEIDIDILGCNLDITVGRTTVIDSIDLENRFGFFRDRTRSPRVEPEHRLRLSGIARGSSIRIRNARS
ncbi:putative DUF1707 family protein [Actinoalloteichus hymeniacidonis]|uniref:DUF1707 family protein n=1 Tax=Actinoalloteichus hymeniacidonis TaxID=340345 RepID=A0AAC9HVG9_9PSEU|nr:putative DUF1707 family protein [Actinoalloteichus hymeniacidonis]